MGCGDELKLLLSESDIGPESDGARKLLKYLELLEKWNARINLTANTEWRSLKPLFLEGIWASKMYPPEAEAHLDIGSGAGFPAIILRILVPRIELELVESRSKKASFLETVIHTLGLESASVVSERLERLLLKRDSRKIWDCISWKGVKLRTKDLLALKQHAKDHTQFWMFHGKRLSVEEPEAIEKHFRLLGRETTEREKGWNLSIYSCQLPVVSCQSD